MTPPLLTIITVCYNAASSIRPTLLSLARQTNQQFEYLVIDGASIDKTTDLVREIYPQAIIHSAPDRGLYDAMNKGLDYATGEYIWYLNAGDTLRDSDIVEFVQEEIQLNNHPDIVYGDTMIVDSQYRDLHKRRLRPPRTLTDRSFSNGMLICHQAFIPRRELAPQYDERYRFSADYDWCIKIIKKSDQSLSLYRFLVNYLNEGLTTRHHRASLWERFRIMAHHYGVLTTIYKHFTFLFRQTRKQ